MRKGFEFFTPLVHDSHQGLNSFEKELGFSLSPLYQIFLTSFEHGPNKLKKGVRYVAPHPPYHNGFFLSNAIINAVDTSWSANIDYSLIRNCGIRKDTIIALGYFTNGYIAKDSLFVEIDCQYDTCAYVPPTLELIIPNLFTPNGDGQNDFFEIVNLPAKHELQIYNRWGSSIYRSKAYQNNWQGEDGVYYFILILEDKSYKGWVQVLR